MIIASRSEPHLPVFPGGNVLGFLKKAREIKGIGKSQCLGDFGDRHVGVEEQVSCFLQEEQLHVLFQALAGVLTEGAGKDVAGGVQILSDILDAQPCVEVCGKVFQDLFLAVKAFKAVQVVGTACSVDKKFI